MFERLFGDRRGDPALAARVPPGQYVTEKFPVLHYGSVPRADLATWDFKVYGEVDNPLRFTWDRVQGPAAQAGRDRHPLRDPLVQARHSLGRRARSRRSSSSPRSGRPRPTWSATRSRATRPTCRCRCWTTTTCCSRTRSRAAPLEPDHGYPLRLIVPKRYFWKGPKWIRSLEFLTHDMPGFWERYGYNNDADPWKEERFSSD